MDALLNLAADPAAWVALVTLIGMELVLGIDNLVFIAILTNKLPENQRNVARRIGIGLAVILRLMLLGAIAFIVSLTTPLARAGFLLARSDPDCRRPVFGVEGDQGDPSSRGSGSRPGPLRWEAGDARLRGSNGSWPCENALEGVSADGDGPDAMRRDRFEHIFPIWVPEASLARRPAILSGL